MLYIVHVCTLLALHTHDFFHVCTCIYIHVHVHIHIYMYMYIYVGTVYIAFSLDVL